MYFLIKKQAKKELTFNELVINSIECFNDLILQLNLSLPQDIRYYKVYLAKKSGMPKTSFPGNFYSELDLLEKVVQTNETRFSLVFTGTLIG